MKHAPSVRTLASLLIGLGVFVLPAQAQSGCREASAADAEGGWAAFRADDMSGARERFEAALARCTDDHYARTGLGYVLLRDGDAAAAATLWSAVIAAEPNNVDALAGLGLAAWRSGDLDAVREHFALVVRLEPDHSTANDYLARIAAAESALPGASDAAAAAWTSGHTSLALELYTERLAAHPSDRVAGLRVALMRAWQGEYPAAIELLDGLVARDPGYLEARLARARVRAWAGDIPRAQGEVHQVLAVQPDNQDALAALALFQAWAGDTEAALDSYEALISISAPHQGRALERQRAQVLAWGSRFEASTAVYNAQLDRNPEDIEARLGLAQTLGYSHHFDASIAEYEHILAGSPREMRALIGKSRTLGWSGRLVEGERVARQAVQADSSSADAWAALGQMYRWQKRDADAKGAFERAGALAPTNALVRDQLRSVNLSLAPLARGTVIYEDDSDGNTMVTAALAASWHPTARLDVQAKGYHKDLQWRTLLRTAQGVTVSGTYQLRPGWLLTGGLGGSRTNGTSNPSLFEYRAGVKTPERHPLAGSLNVTSLGLNETAALAELGGRSTEVLLTGRWYPTPGWRVDGTLGVGTFEGTEDNGRRSASLSASKRLGRFSLGASYRAFSFEKDLDDGYFDPDFYGIAEITSYWLHRPLPWTFLVELAPGVEQVRSDGDLRLSLRSNARIAYQLGPGREVSLSVGYSSAGLASFATGASNYRYTAFILGSNWTF